MPPYLRRNNNELSESLRGKDTARISSVAQVSAGKPEVHENLNRETNSLTMMSLLPRQRQEKTMARMMEPHDNDILMGRGGKNNQHVGNGRLRGLARLQSKNYRNASKKGKSYISRELVKQVRLLNPPGRFLKKNLDTGDYEDVGDDVAREKASQVLRDAVAVTTQSPGASEEELNQGMEEESNAQSPSSSASPVTIQEEELIPRIWNETRSSRSHSTPRQVSSSSAVYPTVCLSASPIMAEEGSRRRTWYETRSYSSHSTPGQVSSSSAFYPPVTPSSNAAKRQRYYHDTWDDRLVSRANATRVVSQHRYHEVASVPPHHVRHCDSPEGRIGEVHSTGLDEFDLFNGELLKSDGEEDEPPEHETRRA
jgi:hypothetical protein